MKKYIVCKINTGKATHIAKSFETPSGIKGYDISCGSNNSGLRSRIYKIDVEITKENITCKKCLAKLEEQTNEKPKKETQAYKLAKLKEYVEKEENEKKEEDKIKAELKKAFENKQSFYLTK